MKHVLFTLLLVLGWSLTSHAQFPDKVNVIDVNVGSSKTIQGDLSSGNFVDLRFGSRGSVNCFGEKEKLFFNGNHVFYAFKVPANTKILVELTASSNMSLYGYMLDANKYDVPPYLERVVNSGCMASHKSKGEVDRVMMKSTDEVNVVIGVAGVNEAANGSFKLKVVTRK